MAEVIVFVGTGCTHPFDLCGMFCEWVSECSNIHDHVVKLKAIISTIVYYNM